MSSEGPYGRQGFNPNASGYGGGASYSSSQPGGGYTAPSYGYGGGQPYGATYAPQQFGGGSPPGGLDTFQVRKVLVTKL
jgi:hypothetical protein